ncbi:hypothetical protein NQZ68_002367 [Dissostichus eleginoides]|nr:hypothetical protein NQZ68_002367 [Dissostichus eleginoides]
MTQNLQNKVSKDQMNEEGRACGANDGPDPTGFITRGGSGQGAVASNPTSCVAQILFEFPATREANTGSIDQDQDGNKTAWLQPETPRSAAIEVHHWVTPSIRHCLLLLSRAGPRRRRE